MLWRVKSVHVLLSASSTSTPKFDRICNPGHKQKSSAAQQVDLMLAAVHKAHQHQNWTGSAKWNASKTATLLVSL
jgi:hypothetical protein